ncbi:MAG TPA: undecaprenyl-diphosphate phosphatase, partial [Streptosporangiaceae bacterium]|nr:undecaprenyl-diphosphate phosphatase [Streptosporangiaceae bacterium]
DLSVTATDSPYLAFIVGMHVATAIAMIIYFWRDWVRIIGGFLTSIRDRRVQTVDQRLAWMIILGTIPIGIVGALLQHAVQKTFAKPVITAVFLAINGVILFGGERLRKRQAAGELADGTAGYADYEDYADYADEDPALAGGRAGRGDPRHPRQYGDQRFDETRVDGPRWNDPGVEETRIDGPRWDDPQGGRAAYADSWERDEQTRGGYGPGDHGPGDYDTSGYRPGGHRPGGYAAPNPGRDGWYSDDADQGGYGPAGREGWDRSGADRRSPAGARHSAPARGQRALREQEADEGIEADRRLVRLGYGRAIFLGSLQILALLPGISRDGIVMIGGMFRGLPRSDAARFSFLLSAPVIFAAGALKLPDLMGPDGAGIRGQVLAGSIVSGIGAFLALRFLVRYLQDHSRTLTPFAIYCLVVGIGSAIYLA